LLGRVYLKKNKYEEALKEFNYEKRFNRSWRPELDAWIGMTYLAMGNKERAQSLLGELIEQSKSTYVSPYILSLVYFVLGDKENGFHLLEKASEESDSWLCEIKAEPAFEAVRQDMRFKDILIELGLD
jgi:tetratricopeptide (TPR) repeat protein